MANRPLLAACSLLMLGLCACTGSSPGASYFPLQAGHQWAYDAATEREDSSVEHEAMTLSTLGEEALDGGGRAYRRRSDSGVDYWLRADDTGTFRVATKTDLEAEPTLDKAPRYVLKMPLAVGTQWQAMTTSYLLRRRNEFPPEIRHTHAPVMMQYRIEALGEKLKTRAGEFSDCIRVQGTASMRLFADPVNGFKDMPLSTTEWYCKGVGLARLVRSEPAQSTFLSGGTLTLELIEWQ